MFCKSSDNMWEEKMKLAVYIALGIAAIGVAFSMAPDVVRYMKMRAM